MFSPCFDKDPTSGQENITRGLTHSVLRAKFKVLRGAIMQCNPVTVSVKFLGKLMASLSPPSIKEVSCNFICVLEKR